MPTAQIDIGEARSITAFPLVPACMSGWDLVLINFEESPSKQFLQGILSFDFHKVLLQCCLSFEKFFKETSPLKRFLKGASSLYNFLKESLSSKHFHYSILRYAAAWIRIYCTVYHNILVSFLNIVLLFRSL